MAPSTPQSAAFAPPLGLARPRSALRAAFESARHALAPELAARAFGPVTARLDAGSPAPGREAAAAAFERTSYAVASGDNLELCHTPPRRIALMVEPTPFTHVSGYSNRFKNLLLQLREAGDEVLVIVPDNHPEAPTEFAGAKIVNVPGFQFPLYRRITLTLGLRGVYGALKEFDPDVIHLTTPGFLVLTTLLFARLLRKPLMLSYHTNLVNYAASYGLGFLQAATWLMLRLEHNRADFTLTTSPQLCEELVSHGFERVGLWRKGIDTNIFNPRFRSSEMRMRLTDGHPEDKLIIYVGRVGMEKNLGFFAPLLARFPGVRLAIVGDGPARGFVEEKLAGTQTVFTGILQGEELAAAFASADVFVMPSESETLGFVVLESMASGVPVVGARAGGVPDIIGHEKNGYLFEPGSVDEAAQYLSALLNDDELRARMGKEAREEATRWSWRASAAATRNLGYGRAMSNFKYRAWNGVGLPRSLTWLRWVRRRLSALRNIFLGGLYRGRHRVSPN
jgi:sulfoquinovosyltransferase